MGESDPGSRPFRFNGSIEVKAAYESVSADAGTLLMRGLMERTGLVRWLEEHLIDDRRPGSVSHPVGSLLRTFPFLIAQGHSDQDDSDRLRSDPSLRASARDTRDIADEGCLASQPALLRFRGMLIGEENLTVLRRGVLKNGIRRLRQAFFADYGAPGVPDSVTDYIGDVPFLVHGDQPGSGCNAYVGHECYRAVVSVCGESGDILGAWLRRTHREIADQLSAEGPATGLAGRHSRSTRCSDCARSASRVTRKLLRASLTSDADAIPEPQAGVLRVRFLDLGSDACEQSLAPPIDELSQTRTRYPGTDLTIIYELPPSQPGQNVRQIVGGPDV